MATNTYVALRTTTLSSATASVTLDLTGVTGYTDIRLVIAGTFPSGADDILMRFNGDTSTNYSRTYLYGTGSSVTSGRQSSTAGLYIAGLSDVQSVAKFDIMNYSNATTYKTVLSRSDAPNWITVATAALWRKTPEAITTIYLANASGNNFGSGTKFTVYGIANAGAAAKATGGIISSDANYYYHTFTGSGTFTPSQSLSCDILAVAGGGGAGTAAGGGGGAGGVITFASQALTATGYTVTVGSGGAKSPTDGVRSSSGTNSTFASLTAAVGGGGGGGNSGSPVGGLNGGSGGGAGGYAVTSPGTSTQTGTGALNYYGNSGGTMAIYCGAGGGGAGAAAGYSTNTLNAGNGGIGIYDALINAMGAGAGIGELSGGNYYVAAGGMGWNGSNGTAQLGGGGGGDRATGGAGVANTGGGGGWYNGGAQWGNGGSGVVVVRYAKV